jgi:hypothetical protein
MSAADEQIEAARLRELRADIEELLREYDVCAHVTLAGKLGQFENFTHVDASWSVLRWEKIADEPGVLGLRLRSKLADYGGDAERQKSELEWSVGVVSGLGELLAHTAMPLLQLAKQVDAATGATHTPWRRDDPRD